MAGYKQPRRLNVVSGALLLLAAAGGYWMYKFFPVYLEAWSVDHILHEGASRVYKIQMMGEPDRTETLTKLVDNAKADIRKKSGVSDPELVVNLTLEQTTATMTADYKVKVYHDWVGKTSMVNLHRSSSADLKRVDWDK